VEVGRGYEVLVANDQELWRYQLNDTVEIAGFIPTEEILPIRDIERKGYGKHISTSNSIYTFK